MIHRVTKVQSGSRVVLNYMLQFEGSMSPAKCLTTPAEGDLQLIRKVVAAGYLLALPLLYAYTAESMGPEFLKGRDAFLFNAFHHAGVNVEVKFVLCVDKTRVYTPNYGPDYDDFPESEWFPCFDRAILVNPEMVQKSLQLKKNLAEKEETLRQERRKGGYLEGYSSNTSKWSEFCSEEKQTFSELSEEILASQKGHPPLTWIPLKGKDGHDYRVRQLWNAESKHHTRWLGNMTPAEEFYYMSAALLVSNS